MAATFLANAAPAAAQPTERTVPAEAAKGFSTASTHSKAIKPVGDEEFGAEDVLLEDRGQPGSLNIQFVLEDGESLYDIRPPA
jgi:hypothetical protein